MLVLFLTFHNHKQEYRPLYLTWRKEGNSQSGWGTALRWKRAMWTLKRYQSNIEGREFPPVILTMILAYCNRYNN
jgi:hypothetical protein